MKIHLSFFILFLFLLLSCEHHVISLPQELIEVKKKEYLRMRISKNTLYKEENAGFYKNILSKINKAYYNNKDVVNIYRVIGDPILYPSIEALPNDNILINGDLLEINTFNINDIAAILCHESAHIINGDWNNAIRKNSEKLSFNFERNVEYNHNFFFSRKKITSKAVKNHEREKNKVVKNRGDILYNNSGILNVRVLNPQDFPIEDEYQADIDAIKCLDIIGIEYKISETIKKTMKEIKRSNKSDLMKRLNRLVKIE